MYHSDNVPDITKRDAEKTQTSCGCFDTAKKYYESGLVPLPVRPELGKIGKNPQRFLDSQDHRALSYSPYRNAKTDWDSLKLLGFQYTDALGVLAGKVSGNLYVFDFDYCPNIESPFSSWEKHLREVLTHSETEIFKNLPIEVTQSSGQHLFCRIEYWIDDLSFHGNVSGLLTNFVRCSPSPGYRLIRGGLTDIPTISNSMFGKMIVGLLDLNTPSKAMTKGHLQDKRKRFHEEFPILQERSSISLMSIVTENNNSFDRWNSSYKKTKIPLKDRMKACSDYFTERVKVYEHSMGEQKTLIYTMSIAKWGFLLPKRESVIIVRNFMKLKKCRVRCDLESLWDKAQCNPCHQPGWKLAYINFDTKSKSKSKSKSKPKSKRKTAKEILFEILFRASNHRLYAGNYDKLLSTDKIDVFTEESVMGQMYIHGGYSETAIRKAFSSLKKEGKADREFEEKTYRSIWLLLR